MNYNRHGSIFAHDPIVKGNWILLEVEPSVWREKKQLFRIQGCGNLIYQNVQASIISMANKTSELSQVNKWLCELSRPPSTWHGYPKDFFFQVLCYSSWWGSIPFLLRSWHFLMIILRKEQTSSLNGVEYHAQKKTFHQKKQIHTTWCSCWMLLITYSSVFGRRLLTDLDPLPKRPFLDPYRSWPQVIWQPSSLLSCGGRFISTSSLEGHETYIECWMKGMDGRNAKTCMNHDISFLQCPSIHESDIWRLLILVLLFLLGLLLLSRQLCSEKSCMLEPIRQVGRHHFVLS